MNLKKWIAATVASTLMLSAAFAANQATKPEAVAMAQKAAAYLKTNGKDKAYPEFNNKTGQFVDRDLYVIVIDLGGNVVAHGANDKLIGKPLMQIKDADGKAFVADMVAVAKTGKPGWVDYKWPNPVSKEIEAKSTYVEPSGDVFIGVGVYSK